MSIVAFLLKFWCDNMKMNYLTLIKLLPFSDFFFVNFRLAIQLISYQVWGSSQTHKVNNKCTLAIMWMILHFWASVFFQRTFFLGNTHCPLLLSSLTLKIRIFINSKNNRYLVSSYESSGFFSMMKLVFESKL